MTLRLRALAIVLSVAGPLACAPASPTRGVSFGDGTALATFDAHSDGAEPFTVDVIFPADGQGAPQRGPFAGAVIVGEDDQPPDAYHWLARALAQRGTVVAVPQMPSDDPSADRQRATVAQSLLRSDRGLLAHLVSDRIAVVGHGAGATAAAHQTIGGSFTALVLLAGAPADGDAVEKLQLPSLAVGGLADCDFARDALERGWSRLPSPTVLAELGGVTHLEFTADDSSERGSCSSSVGIDAAHAQISGVVNAFLDFALRDPSLGPGVVQRDNPGLSVQIR